MIFFGTQPVKWTTLCCNDNCVTQVGSINKVVAVVTAHVNLAVQKTHSALDTPTLGNLNLAMQKTLRPGCALPSLDCPCWMGRPQEAQKY
eukprot:1373325-Amphidinium_carterae.1